MSSPLIVILTGESSRFLSWARALAFDGWEVRMEGGTADVSAACRAADLALILVDLKRASASAEGAALKGAGAHTSVIACAAGDDSRGVISALSNWADDYFPEDLPPELLRAKSRSHLRRLLPQASLKANEVHSSDGALRLDSDARSVFVLGAAKAWTLLCRLTPSEANILRLLFIARRQTVARREIAEFMFKEKQWTGNVSTIDKHVESLRRKLARFGSRIVTVYGVGYVWRDPR